MKGISDWNNYGLRVGKVTFTRTNNQEAFKNALWLKSFVDIGFLTLLTPDLGTGLFNSAAGDSLFKIQVLLKPHQY